MRKRDVPRKAQVVKICLCCHRAFRPAYSDEELKMLFFDAEVLDRHEMWTNDYPPGYVKPLDYPTQELCDGCATNPKLRWEYRMFAGMVPIIEDPKAVDKLIKKLNIS